MNPVRIPPDKQNVPCCHVSDDEGRLFCDKMARWYCGEEWFTFCDEHIKPYLKPLKRKTRR